jgi:hypothetical protein
MGARMKSEGRHVRRRVAIGALAAIVVALGIGIPTGIVETPWYTRMTPVLWWNYPVWAVSSILTGALAATYVRDPGVPVPPSEGGKTFVGSMLSLFAVGCPICNKLVVMALGVSGALTWFAPVQPLLAVVSLGLLAYALLARRRATTACRTSSRSVTEEARATFNS